MVADDAREEPSAVEVSAIDPGCIATCRPGTCHDDRIFSGFQANLSHAALSQAKAWAQWLLAVRREMWRARLHDGEAASANQ